MEARSSRRDRLGVVAGVLLLAGLADVVAFDVASTRWYLGRQADANQAGADRPERPALRPVTVAYEPAESPLERVRDQVPAAPRSGPGPLAGAEPDADEGPEPGAARAGGALQPGQAEGSPITDRVEDLLFYGASDRLARESRRRLWTVVWVLRRRPDAQVLFLGYGDAEVDGSRAAELARSRAAAAVAFVVERGVDPSRVSAESAGPARAGQRAAAGPRVQVVWR